MFLQSQKFTTLDETISILLERKAALLFISVIFHTVFFMLTINNFYPEKGTVADFGTHLMKFKHISNRIVCFRDLRMRYVPLTLLQHDDKVCSALPTEREQNKPYSYSQYWTGTSLQWRLMRGNTLKSICI